MQIHYCFSCNKRVDSDEAVIREQKVFCRACAAQVPAPADDRPLGRGTPARGMQRRTPGSKGTMQPGSTSPAHGTQSPARSSKTNIRPASPAHGVSTRPSVTRSSGGNAIPPRSSSTNITPARQSGGTAMKRPSSGNPVISTTEKAPPRAEAIHAPAEPRRRANNTLIWVLAAVALLLAGIGAALLVNGNSVVPSRPPGAQSK